jgi:hypothetical protein
MTGGRGDTRGSEAARIDGMCGRVVAERVVGGTGGRRDGTGGATREGAVNGMEVGFAGTAADGLSV